MMNEVLFVAFIACAALQAWAAYQDLPATRFTRWVLTAYILLAALDRWPR